MCRCQKESVSGGKAGRPAGTALRCWFPKNDAAKKRQALVRDRSHAMQAQPVKLVIRRIRADYLKRDVESGLRQKALSGDRFHAE
jgi:hypothetical protein